MMPASSTLKTSMGSVTEMGLALVVAVTATLWSQDEEESAPGDTGKGNAFL